MSKRVHQNPDLNIIIHLEESVEHEDSVPQIGWGFDGENKQFVGGKCKEGECMNDGKCIKITENTEVNFMNVMENACYQNHRVMENANMVIVW